MMVLAFIISGLGLMLLFKGASDSGRQSCAEYCSSKGMGYVHAPSGTAGRVVDGTSNPTDAQSYCQCIPRSANQASETKSAPRTSR